VSTFLFASFLLKVWYRMEVAEAWMGSVEIQFNLIQFNSKLNEIIFVFLLF
jgi:hypothetical protein